MACLLKSLSLSIYSNIWNLKPADHFCMELYSGEFCEQFLSHSNFVMSLIYNKNCMKT